MTVVPLLTIWVPSSFDVYVGEKLVEFSNPTPIRNGRLFLVPLRETIAAMGGTYVEGPIKRHVYLTVGRRRVDLALYGGLSKVDGVPKRLKAAPWFSQGQVVVPKGLFGEALHATVVTGPNGRFVRIFPRGVFAAPRSR